VATFTQLGSGNWRVQVRRKTRYVAETFRRRKDGEEWALEMERNIDRNGSSKPRLVRNVRTFGDLIDLHDEDMREVGKPPRRSKAAVMASLKTELGSVKLSSLNRERLIEFGRKRAKQGAGPATLAIDLSFIRTIVTHAAAVAFLAAGNLATEEYPIRKELRAGEKEGKVDAVGRSLALVPAGRVGVNGAFPVGIPRKGELVDECRRYGAYQA